MNHSRQIRFHGTLAALLSSTLLLSPMAVAGIGDVDPAYGFRGTLANSGDLNMMTAMPDGRVLTVAYGDGYLSIYMADTNGQPDSGFGPAGHLFFPLPPGTFDEEALGTAAAATNGSIYLALDADNQNSAQLVRVTAAGALDSGFGANGVVTFPVPPMSTSGSSAQILSIAPLPDGRIAVLVGYFNSIYDCASDLRIFQLTSGGGIQLEYDRAALQAAVGACSEFGGVTLSPLLNGYVSLQAGDAPTAFDPSGKAVTLHLEQTGTTGHAVTLSADASGSYVYVAGPAAIYPYTCSLSRLSPDLLHTSIDGDGDDWLTVDFSSVPDAPGAVRSCKVLANGNTGFVYVEALLGGADGRPMVAVGRISMRGHYYPDLDRSFGSNGIAVLGREAAFGLFAEQADGSLLLAHGGYAGGPAQGGDAVIKLLGSNLPSPGMIFLEAPPYPVPVVHGTPATVSVRRALGSSGAMTATYVVTAQHDGPPISFSPLRNLTFTWGDGEQGARSAEALSAIDAIGHYDVDSTSTPAAVFFYDHGSFSVVASNPPSSGGPISSPPNGGGASNDLSGGGSLDYLALLMLACLLMRQLEGGSARHSRSRKR